MGANIPCIGALHNCKTELASRPPLIDGDFNKPIGTRRLCLAAGR